MSKKAFNKIAAGLNEAIAVARGESKPTRIKRGRPKTTGPGVQVVVRLQPPQLDQLDAFIATIATPDDPVSRPEAVRRLLVDHPRLLALARSTGKFTK